MDIQSSTPKHIAFIMDGNRRWAEERGLPKLIGHQKGAEALKKIVDHCAGIGVAVITVYAFSTENWNRPKDEIDYLMDLIVKWVDDNLPEMVSKGVKFRHLGNREKLAEKVLNSLDRAQEETKNNGKMVFNLAFNYGGRDELVRAVNKINRLGHAIAEDEISQNLDTSGLPDPDLIIRTSGEMRISGFLLWQSAYSELYFTDKYWPDFNGEELDKAINEYNGRQRRFGK